MKSLIISTLLRHFLNTVLSKVLKYSCSILKLDIIIFRMRKKPPTDFELGINRNVKTKQT